MSHTVIPQKCWWIQWIPMVFLPVKSPSFHRATGSAQLCHSNRRATGLPSAWESAAPAPDAPGQHGNAKYTLHGDLMGKIGKIIYEWLLMVVSWETSSITCGSMEKLSKDGGLSIAMVDYQRVTPVIHEFQRPKPGPNLGTQHEMIQRESGVWGEEKKEVPGHGEKTGLHNVSFFSKVAVERPWIWHIIKSSSIKKNRWCHVSIGVRVLIPSGNLT